MNRTSERYLVQCISGNQSHVMHVVAGSELEAKCIARAESGKLDALALSMDECPACIEEKARFHDGFYGCPMADVDGNCQYDCPCQTLDDVSPYDNQVVAITDGA